MLLVSSLLHFSLSALCPGKTRIPMASIEQWYPRRPTAPETHTLKRALHSPFTDCTIGTDSTGWYLELMLGFAGYVQYA
ncbi:hypothetical protein TNCV_4178221 [Trichonephila clavipes]|nr:hypothetical protein TNCV_4178221 [Trichonephila clavipes]